MKKFSIFLILLLFAGGLFFIIHQPAKAIGQTVVVQIVGPTQPPGFSPGLVTIHLYDTVVFVNHTGTSYSISSTDNSFSSPAIHAGQQWSVTFNSTGGHEYHATTATQRMVGEILVVSNDLTLLPTPVPQIEATVVALIKAGKHPPDTIILNPTPTVPAAKLKPSSNPFLTTIFSPLVLGISGGLLLAIFLIFFVVSLFKRRAKRKREEAEMDELVEDYIPQKTVALTTAPVATQVVEAVATAPAKQKRSLLASLHWRRTRKHDDDDDDDDIDDDEE